MSANASTTRIIAYLAVAALSIAILDWGSLYLVKHDFHVATLWPAKGVLLALCLVNARRFSLPLLLAGTLGSIVGKLAAGDAVVYATISSTISSTGVAVAIPLIRHFMGADPDFRDWKKLLAFLAIACAVSVVTGIPGAGFSVWARGGDFATGFVSWTLSTGLSYAILTPTIVLAITRQHLDDSLRQKKRKIALSVAGAFFVTLAVFSQTTFPLTYLVPIALVIVALNAEIEGVAWALLVIAFVSLTATVLGHGPTALVEMSVGWRVLMVQFFLAALTLGILPAAAAITERRKLRDKLTRYLGELERATRAVRESEERFRLMADGASDIVMQSDLQGRIVYVSPSVEHITGLQPSDVVNHLALDLIHPQDRQAMAAAIADVVEDVPAKAGPRATAYRTRRKDGQQIWLESHPTAMRDASGRVTGIQDIVRDITDRKRLEAELVEARERAEAAAAAKAEFLANMSHELRTPLTGIIGYSDLLHRNKHLDDSARQQVESIQSGSRLLLAIINDVLDFSKLENGQLQFNAEPVRPAEIAREVNDLLSAQAKAKKVRLQLNWPTSLAGKFVALDPHRFRQVLLNLVGNAVKFTETGIVKVNIEYDADTTLLRCEVEDTGPGISEDDLGRLFQRFVQAGEAKARKAGGTGLGLAICKAITEGMGGTIGARSVVGKGSVFWFEVPAPLQGRFETAGAAGGELVTKRPAKVMIADDNIANRALVIAALEPQVKVIEARDGIEAVAIAAKEPFDVILMDMRMPGLNGEEALQRIRQSDGPNVETPIVAFSASGDNAALREAGFDGCMGKPFKVDDLIACVAKFSGTEAARRAA
ncbi:MAG TPA: ATP-binding protein [Rhizomicrobium sp.]|nr:ATP-binding protein [Rhizomicrobium sp.]